MSTVWLLTCSLALNMKKRSGTCVSLKWNAKFNWTALGFISKTDEQNSKNNKPNGRFYFQCAQMKMNNISTSGGLRVYKINQS